MTQLFIANHASAIASATLTAGSVRSSSLFERVSVSRSGNGDIALVGAYTGAEDASLELKIVAGSGGPSATAPSFAGVGSGTLSVVSVSPAATVQSLTLALRDKGTVSAYAQLDTGEAIIRAKTTGASGNDIRLVITPALTRVATSKSLLSEWSSGTVYQVGEQWDFGGYPLSASGEINAATPRICFGSDPEVYRPFREFKDGQWRFGLSPALKRSVPAGTKAWVITGSYSVQVTNGVASNSYSATTLFDLMMVLADSPLVTVVGVVAADRRPGGASVIDIPLRTAAWVGAISESDVDFAPITTAPTETLTLRCKQAIFGRDLWSVSGPVSGNLPDAVTGVVYTAGPVASALIPLRGSSSSVTGEVKTSYNPTSRAAGVSPPGVCLNPVKLGIAAKSTEVTFTYKARPSAACACTGKTVGAISNALLGLGGIDVSTLDPALQTRLTSLFAWRKTLLNDWNSLKKSDWSVEFLVGTNTSKFRFFVKDQTTATAYATALAGQSVANIGGLVQLSWTSTTLALPYVNFGSTTGALSSIAAVQGPVSSSSANVHVQKYANAWVHRVVSLLGNALGEFYTNATALAQWDAYFTDAQAQAAELATWTANDWVLSNASTSLEALLDRQSTQMDHCRILGGILPKSNSSIGAGDGCWRDYPDETYWWVDASGRYLPAFNNKVYYAASRSSGATSGNAGDIVNLREFAFGLVVPCVDGLVEGDSISLSIGAVYGSVDAWKTGDKISVDVIGAIPAWLTGGLSGSDTRIWSVSGSVSGSLPILLSVNGSTTHYVQSGLALDLTDGGIPFELGDTFSFSLENNSFQWRKNGGAWSAVTAIPAPGSVTALADGVSASFSRGNAPSFVLGDSVAFTLHQPYSPVSVKKHGYTRWEWVGAVATLTADFGALRPISAVALAGHTLPSGATVTVELSANGSSWQALPVDMSQRVGLGVLAATVSVRYLRITLGAAIGGALGWVWAGVPVTTTVPADSVRLRKSWSMLKGNGINPSALCAGSGAGGEIGWSMLAQADVDQLLAMIDYCHVNDEPLIFVPTDRYPNEAALVKLSSDSIDIDDWYQFQINDRASRVLSMKLPLDGVIA